MKKTSELKKQFLDYLAQNSFPLNPKELFEPANYMMQLGGKRVRPVLLLMSYNLFKADVRSALPIALAYEIFHNFSLVHDDIMDESDLRRGQPTVHQKYDINTGILSGDVMLVGAYEYLQKVQPVEKLLPVLSVFNEVAKGVCIGQQMDINFETAEEVQIADYLKMIEHKTAILIAGALKTGAIIGGGNEQDAQHLYEFGRNMGIAFQLQDDLLDTFGDAATFGKRIGGDIVQNKKTFLYLKALELASPAQYELLKRLYTQPIIEEEAKIAQVKQVFDALNIEKLAKELKREYHQKAMEHLQAVQVPSTNKIYLRQLAEQILERLV